MRLFQGVLVMVAVLAPIASLDASPGRPVYTNKTRFRIPYNFDAAEMKRIGAREIRLYVSTDQGAQWQMAQTVAPEAGRFQFQAPGDGEFWFSVRTVDGQGQLHPNAKINEPGLVVVVDTVPPALELNLRQVAPGSVGPDGRIVAEGRVALSWVAQDPHLDPAQLQMEFIQPGTPNWQSIAIVPKPSDETEWSFPQPGTIAVRGTVTDLAGNVGRAERRLDVGLQNGPAGRPAVPDFNQPIAGNPTPQMANLPPAGAVETNRYPSAVQAQRDAALPSGIIPGQVPLIPSAQTANTPAQNAADPGQQRPMTSFVSSTRNTNSGAALNTLGRRVRIINSRQFNIGYKLNDVGPSGISHVEMYLTTDDGATWHRYGEDADNKSPFLVEVPSQGLYGLTLVVRSGVGIAADPPRAGDKPNMVVLIDSLAPAVELMPVEQGQGSTANNLLIRWRTREDHPAERPVSLFYSSNRQGPWQPIAMGLEDQGNFAWSVGSEVPSRFFVRVEVRDAAGNLGRSETAEPLTVDLSRPTAEIVDIETGIAPAP